MKGLPDGLKVDKQGNLWATGPGGVHIFSPQGKPLGRIDPGEATANCAWGGPDGSILYLTADMSLARIQTSTSGANSEEHLLQPTSRPNGTTYHSPGRSPGINRLRDPAS